MKVYGRSPVWITGSFLALGLMVAQCTPSPETEEPIVSDNLVIPAEPGETIEPEPVKSANIIAEMTVYFAFDSDVVTPEGQTKLSELATQLKASSENVRISGHCDSRGSVQYNIALGQRRADAVKTILIDMGVSESQIGTLSYGKERLVLLEDSEDAHAQNRRAELKVN